MNLIADLFSSGHPMYLIIIGSFIPLMLSIYCTRYLLLYFVSPSALFNSLVQLFCIYSLRLWKSFDFSLNRFIFIDLLLFILDPLCCS